MILAAGLLVLVGLGLFVAGVLTGDTPFYWACVGACVVAAVLLVVARLRMSATPATPAAPAAPAKATAAGATAAGRTQAEKASEPAGAEPAEAAPAAAADAAPTVTAPPPATTAPAATAPAPAADAGEPPVEEVEVTDLLLVVDVKDEVLVVDEHPRYHVSGCRHLAGQETIPIPLDEAKTDGFTPCGICRPDSTIADRVRAAK